MQLRHLMIAGLFLAACTPLALPANEPSATVEPSRPLSPASEAATETPESPTPRGPAPVEPTRPPETAAIPPELWEKIAADLEARTSANRTAFTILRAEAVTWNDGSLGCPQPGMVYTQALEDGYRIVVEWSGQPFNYHAAQRGFFVLCKPATSINQGTLGPTVVITLPNTPQP